VLVQILALLFHQRVPDVLVHRSNGQVLEDLGVLNGFQRVEHQRVLKVVSNCREERSAFDGVFVSAADKIMHQDDNLVGGDVSV
jgi:hypothetical protein